MKRGEVWWVEFDPSVGSEIRKTRPAILSAMTRQPESGAGGRGATHQQYRPPIPRGGVGHAFRQAGQ